MATASEVIARVRDTLQDLAETRWGDPELFRWLDDAQRSVINLRPESNSGVLDVSLVTGARQMLPPSALILIRMIANGTQIVPTSAISEASRDWYDRSTPAWLSDPSATDVDQFMRDADKNVFYVYPPNDGVGRVSMQVGLTPVNITSGSTLLSVTDVWLAPLVEYVCYKALSKDADNAANRDLAQGYLTQFYASLGVNLQSNAPAKARGG